MENIINLIKSSMIPIHKEGYLFIGIGVILSLILMSISDTMGWVAVVITLFVIFFFRDPYRVAPEKPGLVVSPADGIVCNIDEVSVPSDINLDHDKMLRISIFLNVFDVHVNRVPIEGKILQHRYHQGKFLSANLDKASEDNERNSFLLETDSGENIIFVQIAGLIARRIVWNIHEGDRVETGQKFGIIRFGSRVDIYLPADVEPLVLKGQRMIGGETVIADLSARNKDKDL